MKKAVFRVCLVIAGLIIFVAACAWIMHMRAEIDHQNADSRLAMLVGQSTVGEPAGRSALQHSGEWTSADFSAAKSYVLAHPDWTAYHALMVLESESPTTYAQVPPATKGAILCSALSKAQVFNDWGHLTPQGPYDGFAAKALLAVGREALPELRPLLDNADPAMLAGSKEATISFLYKYRRKDFAYHYACSILGLPYAFAPEPQDRDKDVEVLKRKLDTLLGEQRG